MDKKILVKNNIITEIHKRKLGKFEFYCKKCNKIHKMSAYAIAQRAMGVSLIFNCDCGNKIDL